MWFGQSGFPNFIQILAGTNFYCYFGDFPHEFLTVSWTHNTTQGMGATLVVSYSQTCDKYQNTSIYVKFFFLLSFIATLCTCVAWTEQFPLQPVCRNSVQPSIAHVLGVFFLLSFIASLCACVCSTQP